MFLEGIGIAGYRSFGFPPQRFGPLGKINVIIGQNNSGKSNLLRFLSEQLHPIHKAISQNISPSFDDLDRPIGIDTEAFEIEFGASVAGEFIQAKREAVSGDRHVLPLFDRLLTSDALTGGGDVVWIPYRAKHRTEAPKIKQGELVSAFFEREQVLQHDEWRQLWSALCPGRGGGNPNSWIPEVIHSLNPFSEVKPAEVEFIPAFRKVGGHGLPLVAGGGIVEHLAQLQNPELAERQKQEEDFARIHQFLRDVTGVPDARLEVPFERRMVLVHMDNRILPLESLGTGIHEVVILAAASTVLHNKMVCIEEPEIHLHPTLQKKLIRYLDQHTTNQYFVATHSASILDSASASVFHVTLEDGFSKVAVAISDKDRFKVCSDLGYKASDLVQTNCVVWVEGPSDRILLNHWVSSLDDTLVEGLNYSIMFYGGRLLSHLSADDPDVDDFISLRRLNRNVVVLMDSDRLKAGQKMSATKRRVRDETDEGPGFAWVTKGREIENYVAPDVMKAALRKVHGENARRAGAGDYDTVLPSTADKVRIAGAVADQPAELDVMNLRQQIIRLVNFIRECNELPALR